MKKFLGARSRVRWLRLALFSGFLALGPSSRGATIPAARLPASPWTGNVGVPGGIPTNYTMFCNVRVSIPGTNLVAAADGITDDAPAINFAVQNCPNGQYVYLPAGTYRTNSTITRQGVNYYDNVQRPFSIEIKGDGPALTKILFYGGGGDAMYFNAAGGEDAQTMAIASGDARGSTHLVVTNPSPYLVAGIYAIVHRLNAEATTGTDPAYMIDTASQMVKVTAVNAATGAITFTPALNEAYPSDYLTIGISAPYRTGVQDLYIENMSDQNGHTINFNLGQECWVKNVESYNTAHWHVHLQTCARCEVRECLIHDGWEAGGDHDYGVGLFQYSCNNLVENNVFYDCRHAMEMEYGGQDNVFGYNYSFNPVNSDLGYGLGAELATDYLMGDELNHGGDIRWNLREGNVAATIRFDCVLGANSYNTVFRNQIQRRGLPPVVVANFGSDLQKWSYYSNLSGNVYEAPPVGFSGVLRRWGTNQDSPTTTWTVTGASNTNPIVLAVSGSAFGTGDVVTVSGVLGNTAANVTGATITYVDANHFSLNGVNGTASGAYSGGGTVVSGPDAQSQTTTLLDGEYDFSTTTLTWAGADESLPASYYLTAKPVWFGNLAWPAIDPSSPHAEGTALIPAGFRQANGAPPPTAPYVIASPAAITVAAGTPATLAAAFEGYPAPSLQWQVSSNGGSSWTTITSGGGYTVTNLAPPLSTSATDNSSKLTVATANTSLSGNLYQCIATNADGQAATASAELTITGSSSSAGSSSSSSSSSSSGSGSSSSSNLAPAITSQPQSQSMAYLANASVSFSVVASGTPTPTYQWKLGGQSLVNGGRIAGATSATLTISSPQVSDSGSYTVVASNGVSPTATSAAANLTVSPLAQTITFPALSAITLGGAAPILAATASSGLAVSYSSSNPAVASVSGGSLTIAAAGSAVITATQAGNGNYSAATAVTRTLTVNAAAVAPVLTSGTATTATTGSAFTYTLTASHSPTSFTATGLPAGLSLNSTTGIISGIPTTAGTYQVHIGASNPAGSASATFVVTVSASAVTPILTSGTSATATVGAPFTYTLTANNNATSFTATGLPAGLTINSATGIISGTPTTAGTYQVHIGASNTAGSASATFVVTVSAMAAAPILTSGISATATTGAPFTYTLTASNSATSFTASGLPAGLTLDSSTGVINGIPTTDGSYQVQIGASNAAGSASATLVLTVSSTVAAPALTIGSTAAGTVGSAFTYTLTATGSPTAFTATNLPPGLSLDSATGIISGLPSAAGSYTVQIGASNPAGSDTGTLIMTIAAVALPGPTRTYFGTFSSGGSWALNLAGNNTGLFLSLADGVPAAQTVTVGADGQFTVSSSTTSANLLPRTATITLPYVITLGASTATGTAGSSTLSGSLDTASPANPYAGSYITAGVQGASGNVYVIVGPDGRVFALEVAGSAADGASGTLSATGTLNTATAGGGELTLTTSSTAQMLATFTAAGTSTVNTYLGLASGTASTSRIINLSARAQVQTGANILIAGAVVSGASKSILVRAVGPALTSFGVANALSDPELSVFQGSNLVVANSGWGGGAALAADFTTVGAFALPSGSADDAVQVTLAPTGYTIQVAGANGGTGTALAEIYDLDSSAAPAGRLIDISARAQVSPSSNLIAGFVISGNGPETILIRAIGPGLAQFGITGVLSAPVLVLADANGNTVASNQGWGGQAALADASASVGAFAVDPASADSELLITLTPGSYTAVVSGANSTSGTALVEVYEVQ